MISGQTIGLPILNITKDIGVIPSMRLVLTPYAVLEKRFLLNFFTKDKEINMGFSYDKAVHLSNNVYYRGLGINKIFSFNEIDIGGSLAVWKQPELLSDYLATADSKWVEW
ncbi:hypothetical protein LSO9J_60030 [Candidatus Liberibacter solanacearum]